MANEWIRADHVGSFLRPASVLAARTRHQARQISDTALRQFEDAAILDLLKMQQSVGLPIYSDGEFRREAWQTGFSDAVDGFVAAERNMVWTDLNGQTTEEISYSKVVGGKLRARRRFTETESPFLRRHAPGPYKITMPSPILIARHSFKEGVTDQVYSSPAELLEDVLAIMHIEVEALLEEGVKYLQFDEGFTRFIGNAWRDQVIAQGQKPEDVLAQAVADENRLYDRVERRDATFAIHICRGNSKSRWSASGTYDALAEQVFGHLNVDRFLLEYDSDRAGDFAVLRHLPKRKVAVLGLISTKIPLLESEDNLLRRIDEASKYASIEQLAISPQCGFASVLEGNVITVEQQKRKLELTVKIAARVWG